MIDEVTSDGGMSEGPLSILIVCATDPSAPGEKQALWAASALAGLGHRATVAFSGTPVDLTSEGVDRQPGLQVLWHRFRGPRLRGEDRLRAAALQPDLIHAWSPRNTVMVAARDYIAATGAPLFVHWLDDEWTPLDGIPSANPIAAAKLALRRRLAPIHPMTWNVSTPRSLRWAESEAIGFDALTPALAEEVRARTGRAATVIMPISPESAWGSERAEAPDLPASLTSRKLLLYTGDIHFGREPDVRIALQALPLLQRAGHEVTFVHAGRNTSAMPLIELAATYGAEPGSVVMLGTLPFAQIPPLLRRAAVLLQPGHPSDLNRLALASKMQAYLASGTPCVSFAVGAGELLRDREEALLTYTADPAELAARIAEALTDEALRARLAEGGPRAARRLFDPITNAQKLVAHYRAALDRLARLVGSRRSVHRG